MSANNDANRFVLPDNLTQDWLIPYALSAGAIPVAVGDLMYDATGDVAFPADQQASQGSEASDQVLFASGFCGVSQEQVLAAETNALKRITLRTEGVMSFKCPSQTWAKGNLVGIYSDGVHSPDPQQVDRVSTVDKAIGVVVKAEPTATTRVRVYLIARNYTSLKAFSGSTFGDIIVNSLAAGDASLDIAGKVGTNGTSGTAGGTVPITAAVGGTATTGTAGAGGAEIITSGAGGAASGAAGIGGAGGVVGFVSGAGGASSSGTGGVAGAGGTWTHTGGVGGAAAGSAASGGAGGGASWTFGAGGTSAGSATAGAGGGLSATLGAGGACTASTGNGGAGGGLTIICGAGGTSFGGTAGAAGKVSFTAGNDPSGATPTLLLSSTDTTTGNVTDMYTGALRSTPVINGANTITRLNYWDVNQFTGAATVTNACVMRFNAAIGTHKAVDAATTKTTPGGVDAWIKVNLNGTLAFVPAYLSKTA